MSNSVSEWRYRLKISQETAAELLGVSVAKVKVLEISSVLISKPLKLAMLACEIAYIAADQYREKYPSTLNNIGQKNQSETLGRNKIIDGFLNEHSNTMKNDLTITLASQSPIHRIAIKQ
jgi:transcriptional regulator with XRE-family HTH domain